MSDERLRELERRWKETGDAEDEGLYVRELIRSEGFALRGSWRVEGSQGRFNIATDDGLPSIVGWDEHDGERFQVSDIHWDGDSLRATFTMPSTRHTTTSTLKPLGADKLEGSCSGDYEGDEVWLRSEELEPPTVPTS